VLKSNYIGAIAVAAYSYMALVPIIHADGDQSGYDKKERMIRMPYEPGKVSRFTRIAFPIICNICSQDLSLRRLLLL